MLFKDAVNLFSQYLRAEKMRSLETCRAYRGDLEDFQGFLGEVDPGALTDIGRIDSLLIREFLADRFVYLKKESLARKVACIRSFFRFLVREGIVDTNPASTIRAPKRSRPLPRALSVDDMDRFFKRNSAMSKRDAAIFELLYSSGLRVGELASLKLNDIDLENGWVRVIGKGRKERYVPVGARAVDAVRQYISVRGSVRRTIPERAYTDKLFLNSHGGPLSPRSIRRILKVHLLNAGLSLDASPHSFRHSFATHMLHGGADLRSIQEMMGHASLSTTQRYTKVDLAKLMQVYDEAHPRSGFHKDEV